MFLDVGIRGGVTAPLIAFALLFASGYLEQRELYRLRLLVTLFFLAVFMVIGTAWILVVT